MWRHKLTNRKKQRQRAAITLAKINIQDRARATQVFSASIVALGSDVPGVVENQDPDVNGLSEEAVKILVKCGMEPGVLLTDIYKDLGLHPTVGKRGLDELIARGVVKVHRIPRKGRGSQYSVVEITDDGELGKHGIQKPKQVLKGGFKHDVYGRWLGRWAAAKGWRYWWERTLGKKTFDFVYESPQGLVAVEVCLTGSAKWNAEQAIKGAENYGISELIVACETQKIGCAIMKELEKSDTFGVYRSRIRMCQLAEFLE